jgi:formate dehydrogenase iron-sulfur subunit
MPLAVGAHVGAALVTYYESDNHTYYVSMTGWLGLGGARLGVGYGLTLLGWVAGAVGLGASVAHLGQPLRAWKIFLGWRKSWLSREGMLFGAWFAVATASVLLPLPVAAEALHAVLGISTAGVGSVFKAVVFASAALGLLGIFCSAMIYIDTQRKYWRWTQTGPRFFGSAAILGAAAAFALGIDPRASAWVLGLATVLKLAFEVQAVRPAGEADEESPPTPTLNTARLLSGPLRGVWGSRVAAALIFSVFLPAMSLSGVVSSNLNWLIFGGVLVGELTERVLFFRAVDAPKMPGLPAGVARKGRQHR